MRIAITGADGFLGRHLRVRLRALNFNEVVAIGHEAFADPSELRDSFKGVDSVVHLAGVNRGESDFVEMENPALARSLVSALDAANVTPTVLYANSVHAGAETPYGRGKQLAAELLATWSAQRNVAFFNIVFQNIFGEWGKPDYNSFVATFCHRLASGTEPVIDVDRSIELMHAQEAATVVTDCLSGPLASRDVPTHGHRSTVRDVLSVLQEMAETYAKGRIPTLNDPFTVQLFNTYRAYLGPEGWMRKLDQKSDPRGTFVEVVQSLGGQGQTSFSSTVPGVTRGNHFHLRKFERFVVVKGRAQIAMRPVAGEDITYFDVSGEDPSFVDIPTLHTHNIRNIGDEELLTLFWTNEIFDPSDPDTYADAVQ